MQADGRRRFRFGGALAAAVLVGGLLGGLTAAPAGAATVVTTEAELRAAFAADTDIVLDRDITLTDCSPGEVYRADAGTVVLDGAGHTVTQTCAGQRVFHTDNAALDLTVRDLTVTGGNVTDPVPAVGGGLLITGRLTGIGLLVTGNSAVGTSNAAAAGAVAAGEVILIDSVVSGNSTTGSAADVCFGTVAATATATILRTTITGNTVTCADDDNDDVDVIGAALYSGGSLTVTDSRIADTVVQVTATTGDADFFGTVTADDEGPFVVTGSTISRNRITVTSGASASAGGGGIGAFGPTTVTDSTIDQNHLLVIGDEAFGVGGGILDYSGPLEVVGSDVTENEIIGSSTTFLLALGGGIAANIVSVSGSTVVGNRAAGDPTADGLNEAGGGGVYGEETLSVVDSVVVGNAVDGVLAEGGGLDGRLVDVARSTVSRNAVTGTAPDGGQARGGGIRAVGGSVVDSTVADNVVIGFEALGGGIAHADYYGIAEVPAGAIASARPTFGGLAARAIGGAAVPAVPAPPVDDSLRVVNSTVTGNAARATGLGGRGGGIYEAGAIHGLATAYVTLAGNAAAVGANLAVDPQVAPTEVAARGATLMGTVVADPWGGGSNCDGPGPIASQGFDYSTDGSCGFTAFGDTQNGASPQLAAPADNGGPTETMLPATTSPLVNAIPEEACTMGNAVGVTTDQRGVARPQFGRCDIGAVELAPPPRFTG